jgi:hypothetical protein
MNCSRTLASLLLLSLTIAAQSAQQPARKETPAAGQTALGFRAITDQQQSPTPKPANPQAPATRQPDAGEVKPRASQPDRPPATQPERLPAEQRPTGQRKTIAGTITSVTPDFTILSLSTPDAVNIKIIDQALKDTVKTWTAGEQVIADVNIEKNDGNDITTLVNLKPRVEVLPWWQPVVSMLAVVIVFAIVTSRIAGDWKKPFLGDDGRYSNSRVQMTLWFGLVVITYLSAFALRWLHLGFLGSIGIPANLLALTGLSGLTFAGAKAITTQKVATAAAITGAPTKTNASPSFPGDLVNDDNNHFDFGDYQMIIITLIAVLTYLTISYHFLANLEARAAIQLPDVDGAILALFGVGQGAYLTKKATSDISH